MPKTMCIIYQRKDSYEAEYIKEFFRWIGGDYFAYCYELGDENILLENPSQNRFDIVVCINYGLNVDSMGWFQNLKQSGYDLISFEVSFETEENRDIKLKKIISEILRRKEGREISEVLEELIDIYCNNQLDGILYDYIYNIAFKEGNSKVLNDTEAVYKNCLKELENLGIKDKIDYVHFLYAQLYCKVMINEISQASSKRIPYDTEDHLEKVDELYDYDKTFFKAEYLKSKFTMIDLGHRLLTRNYIETYLQDCSVDLCKSYYYYNLGRKLNLLGQFPQSTKAYKISYRLNKLNVRAIFKLGVECFELMKYEEAKQYFIKILENLNLLEGFITKEYLKLFPPTEAEYGYKAYILLARMEKGEKRELLEEQAKKIQQYLLQKDNIFLEKMYLSAVRRQEIYKGIQERFERRRFDILQLIKEEDERNE